MNPDPDSAKYLDPDSVNTDPFHIILFYLKAHGRVWEYTTVMVEFMLQVYGECANLSIMTGHTGAILQLVFSEVCLYGFCTVGSGFSNSVEVYPDPATQC